jgi:hypothetical protein
MREAPEVDAIAEKHVLDIVGMQRIDLGVLGGGEVIDVVTLNRLVEEGEADEKDGGQD